MPVKERFPQEFLKEKHRFCNAGEGAECLGFLALETRELCLCCAELWPSVTSFLFSMWVFKDLYFLSSSIDINFLETS